MKGRGPSKTSSASPAAKKKAVATPKKKKAQCAKGAVTMEIGSAAGGDDED